MSLCKVSYVLFGWSGFCWLCGILTWLLCIAELSIWTHPGYSFSPCDLKSYISHSCYFWLAGFWTLLLFPLGIMSLALFHDKVVFQPQLSVFHILDVVHAIGGFLLTAVSSWLLRFVSWISLFVLTQGQESVNTAFKSSFSCSICWLIYQAYNLQSMFLCLWWFFCQECGSFLGC